LILKYNISDDRKIMDSELDCDKKALILFAFHTNENVCPHHT
jgi:hypothetical protein